MKKRDFKSILLLIKKYVMKRDKLVVLPKTEAVAPDLDVKGGTLRSWDSRNVIPYAVILDYCIQEGFEPLDIFYEKL